MRTAASWAIAVGLALATLGCAGSPQKDPATAEQAPGQAMSIEPPVGDDREPFLVAVELIDARNLDGAVVILEALRKRHPNSALVLHELALAHRLANRPEKAVELLAPYKERLPPESLAALGSAFDEMGNRSAAEAVLKEALGRFPDSGILHSELATTWAKAGKVGEALELYEHGTQVDPSFPANHLNLAKLLAHSRASGMALVHGEVFRLLEPTSPRSVEIGALLFDVCRKGVKITKKAGAKVEGTVSLAPDIVIESPDDLAHLPLANVLELAFGPGLLQAHSDGFNLANLHKAREALLAVVNKPGSPYDWNAVPLFRWLKALHAAGHLEAYDYWLYGPGLVDESDRWTKDHREQVVAMVKYLVTHPLFPPKSNSMLARFPHVFDPAAGGQAPLRVAAVP